MGRAQLLLGGGLAAQNQPAGYFSTACIKVQPGKGADYRQFVSDYSGKVMQSAVQAGEIAGWTLLRGVLPAGEEARCDYVSVTSFNGTPLPPGNLEWLTRNIDRAGLKLAPAGYLSKRDSVSRLVASELWRSVSRVADMQKGDYMFVNFMKPHDMAEYVRFEQEVWKPLAEAFVKDGALRAWMFSTAVLPGGTELKYRAVSVDVFPDWDAAMKGIPLEETFRKVHPGRSYQATMTTGGKLRDLARRELYVVHDRAVGKQSVSQR